MRHADLSLKSALETIIKEDIVNVKKQYGNDFRGKIEKAIDQKHYLYINYDDGKGKRGQKYDEMGNPRWGNPKFHRIILPFAFYESNQNGEDTLRAVHWNDRHTKRGPHKWKEFKVSHMKNLRFLKSTFTDADIPDDANWDGDKHAAHIYCMVQREETKNPTIPQGYEEKFISPLERERERFRRDQKGMSSEDLYTNQTGYIPTKQNVPQIKKGRNLKTMQNLGKPGNIDYKKAYDAFKNSDARKTFMDWDAAEKERQEQMKQNKASNPVQSHSGPIGYDENDYDVNDVEYNENNFLKNTNKK